MNYYYYEYMIKERHKEAMEECERIRLLNDAGLVNAGLMERKGIAVVKVMNFQTTRLKLMVTSFLRNFFHRSFTSEVKGRCV